MTASRPSAVLVLSDCEEQRHKRRPSSPVHPKARRRGLRGPAAAAAASRPLKRQRLPREQLVGEVAVGSATGTARRPRRPVDRAASTATAMPSAASRPHRRARGAPPPGAQQLGLHHSLSHVQAGPHFPVAVSGDVAGISEHRYSDRPCPPRQAPLPPADMLHVTPGRARPVRSQRRAARRRPPARRRWFPHPHVSQGRPGSGDGPRNRRAGRGSAGASSRVLPRWCR
jgi:hypothetical protein